MKPTYNSIYKVYKHTSPSRKSYIGVTYKEISERFRRGHCKEARKTANKVFPQAIKKYGSENFISEELFRTEDEVLAYIMESAFIKYFGTYYLDTPGGYNMTLGGENPPVLCGEDNPMYGVTGKNHPRYGCHHTDEHKKYMAKLMTGVNSPNYGIYKHTEEWKKDCSKRMTGEGNPMFGVRLTGEQNHMFGKHHTDETKRLLSEKLSGNNHPSFEVPLTPEQKEHLRIMNTGDKNPMFGKKQKRIICEYCGSSYAVNVIKRHRNSKVCVKNSKVAVS